jgi:hypothetical protein
MKMIKKALRGFVMFWWNFLVGDTPELFVAVVAILGTAALFRTGHGRALMFALPVMVVAALTTSVIRAIRRR